MVVLTVASTLSTSERRTTYRRTADAFRSGNHALLASLIHPDVVWHVPGELLSDSLVEDGRDQRRWRPARSEAVCVLSRCRFGDDSVKEGASFAWAPSSSSCSVRGSPGRCRRGILCSS